MFNNRFSETEMFSFFLSVHSASYPKKGQCSPSWVAEFFNFCVLFSSTKDFFKKSAIVLCVRLLVIPFFYP